MIYSKIRECVIILWVAIPQKWRKSVSDGLFFRVDEGFWEKKCVLQEVVLLCVEKNIHAWKKNNFGSLKNGCIFAPAFDGGSTPSERVTAEAENIEVLGSGDSVCQSS